MTTPNGASRRTPNLFIVGAPRCGTTAMYHYLRAHPAVFMCEPRKEPQYFGRDIDAPHFIRDEREYLALFDRAENELWLGEASTWYIYSDSAAAEIKGYSPDAKIIIMLRNPVDMIYSWYRFQRLRGQEDISTFEGALLAEEPRAKDNQLIPPHIHFKQALFYREMGRLAEPVNKYIRTFGRGNVCLVVVEELAAWPVECWQRICQFLDIDDSIHPAFQVYNASRDMSAPRVCLAATRWLAHLGSCSPAGIRRGIRRASILKGAHPNRLSREVRAVLYAGFLAEIRRLSSIVGTDLTRWWRP